MNKIKKIVALFDTLTADEKQQLASALAAKDGRFADAMSDLSPFMDELASLVSKVTETMKAAFLGLSAELSHSKGGQEKLAGALGCMTGIANDLEAARKRRNRRRDAANVRKYLEICEKRESDKRINSYEHLASLYHLASETIRKDIVGKGSAFWRNELAALDSGDD